MRIFGSMLVLILTPTKEYFNIMDEFIKRIQSGAKKAIGKFTNKVTPAQESSPTKEFIDAKPNTKGANPMTPQLFQALSKMEGNLEAPSTTSKGFVVKDNNGNKSFVFYDNIPQGMPEIDNNLEQGISYSKLHPLAGAGSDQPIIKTTGLFDQTFGGPYSQAWANSRLPTAAFPIPVPQDIRNATSTDSQIDSPYYMSNSSAPLPGGYHTGIQKSDKNTGLFDVMKRGVDSYDQGRYGPEIRNLAPVPVPGQPYQGGQWNSINKAPDLKSQTLAKTKPNAKVSQSTPGTINGKLV